MLSSLKKKFFREEGFFDGKNEEDFHVNLF